MKQCFKATYLKQALKVRVNSCSASLERLTTLIACKGALHERKMEEWRLRSGKGSPSRSATATAMRYAHLNPPLAVRSQTSYEMPLKVVAKDKQVTAAKKLGCTPSLASLSTTSLRTTHTVQSGMLQNNIIDVITSSTIATSSSSTQNYESRLTAQQLAEAYRRMEEQGIRSDENVRNMGLPGLLHFNVVTLPQLPKPQWLLEAIRKWKMKAHIIDFWRNTREEDRKLKGYLEYLGFNVTMDQCYNQTGQACGYVAARNLVTIQTSECGLSHVALHDSVKEDWIHAGNALIDPHQVGDRFLWADEIKTLAKSWLQDELDTRSGSQNMSSRLYDGEGDKFITSICAFDQTLREIIDELQNLVKEGRVLPYQTINPRKPSLRLRVANNKNLGSSGQHWITIAYTIENRTLVS